MNELLSTGQLSKLLGVSLSTIYRWLKSNKIKEPKRTFGNHRRFNKFDFVEQNQTNILYSRVSSYGQKDDLKRQTYFLENYSKQNNIKNTEIISDIGSGLNFNKKGFKLLLKKITNYEIDTIYIQNKDRLSRFGVGIIEAFCNEFNTKLIIIDQPEQTYETKLMYDLMSLLTTFSGSIHGRRSHKNKIKTVNG